MTDNELVRLAFEARTHAYTPYSHFMVGAALLCEDGTVYQGANIENASYGVCLCAERTALARAVFEGKRDFRSIAIVGGPEDCTSFDFCVPCGICRQALHEFVDPGSFRVLLARSETSIQSYRFDQLFPLGFDSSSL